MQSFHRPTVVEQVIDDELLRLAREDNVVAQRRLGEHYYHGLNRAEDNDAALYWFTRAASQGDAHSQARVGDMYQYGLGTKPDNKLALEWYSKAAEQGNTYAMFRLAWFYDQGKSQVQFPKSRSVARKYFKLVEKKQLENEQRAEEK